MLIRLIYASRVQPDVGPQDLRQILEASQRNNERDGITGALDHVRQHFTGNVLLVSSGGPIATAVGHILGTPPETTIELNMRIRNSAVSEFVFSEKRHSLLSFNHLPHLQGSAHADWVTYS